MRIAVCDDEQVCTENVIKHLDYFSVKNNIEFEKSIFNSAVDLLSCNKIFDIAILDVEMDDTDGLNLGEKLRTINPHIVLIYITAHKKYLDDALNINAVSFFEKPIDSQRFYRGLMDAIKRIDNNVFDFYLKDGKTIEKINANDILFIEIEKRKTKMITINKEYHSNHSIDYWQSNLKSTVFVSPHKSYIVNLNFVTKYERNYVILNDIYEIPIARNKQPDFYKKFICFMEGK